MKCKTILWRLVWFSTYVLIGAVIFMHLENNDDNNLSGIASENSLTDQLMRALNISRENITAVIKDYCQGFCACREKKKSWSFLNSIDFVLQLLTTIGYGNFTPVTPFGQLFAIAYAIPGIPLTVIALRSVGKLLNIGLRATHRPLHNKFHGPQCKEEDCDFLEKGSVCCSIGGFILMWMIVFSLSFSLDSDQNRSFVTIIYSIFITYSTVGFGDFIPFESSRYVFIITLLPGLALVSSSIDSVVACIEKRNKLHGYLLSCKWRMSLRKNRKTTNGGQDTQMKGARDKTLLQDNTTVSMETTPSDERVAQS